MADELDRWPVIGHSPRAALVALLSYIARFQMGRLRPELHNGALIDYSDAHRDGVPIPLRRVLTCGCGQPQVFDLAYADGSGRRWTGCATCDAIPSQPRFRQVVADAAP